jgi:superfamily II DNA or RNA helicase
MPVARSALALIAPFDRITPIRRSTKWRLCGAARAVARFASAVRDVTAGGIAGMLAPDLALLPWQWAAATLVRRGGASAVLIADAVGLGKTIQAALVVAALRARGDGQRVLILVPAGLRDQWRAELQRLFGFEASVLDAGALGAARRAMPSDVNPWSVMYTTIASIDYVKRPEVLAAAAGVAWDVLVVDEAHALRSGSDRREAAAALAGCARHVLLLSATPHAGSADEFAALCRVGEIAGDDGRTIVIRRTRADVGHETSRRVHIARVAPNAAERLMHARLEQYARTVWRERGTRSPAACLAMTVLLKRAASSAWALRRSIDHRLFLLAGAGQVPPTQAVLPFGDPGETDGEDAELSTALAEPGLDERSREVQWLAELAEVAQAAAARETKPLHVARLLRRAGEPAIVFTEYRDTLDALRGALDVLGPIAVLHGGLPRAQRREAERAFTAGNVRVLLATDAASEGLNLHARCRLVVNVELPWNPVRLEQRIGRIDRIGQRSRVHAVHLVGRDTAEHSVLRRLVGRARSIREALGGDDPSGLADIDLAAGALQVDLPEARASVVAAPSVFMWSDVNGGARAVCELLESARNLIRHRRTPPSAVRASTRLPVGVVGPRLRRRLSLEPGVVLGFRVDAVTASGRSAASTIVVVHVALAAAACRAKPAILVPSVLTLARRAALDDGMRRLAPDLDGYRHYIARATARETALLETVVGGDTTPAVQAGLFDRLAIEDAARQESQRERRRVAHAARLEQLALDARLEPVARAEPLVALVLR